MLSAASVGKYAQLDLDPRSPQTAEAATGNLRMRIDVADDHLLDASLDEQVRARPRATAVCAGLEGDCDRRSAHSAPAGAAESCAKGHDFSVVAADRTRVTATEHGIAPNHHRTHRRIGKCATACAARLRECKPHGDLCLHSSSESRAAARAELKKAS